MLEIKLLLHVDIDVQVDFDMENKLPKQINVNIILIRQHSRKLDIGNLHNKIIQGVKKY